MSTIYLTREQSRRVDQIAMQQYHMRGVVLMENAGRGCADRLCELGIHGPVAICCGKGNNAGDGFVIARHLELRGHQVQVLLWSSPGKLAGDAAENFAILQRAQTAVHIAGENDGRDWLARRLAGADWAVDALLGTGARGAPRPPLDEVIRALNATAARKMAVDLPSGLDCDTGQPSAPTFRADHTCTFFAPKVGFQSPQARPYLGQVHVVDIGVPRRVLEEVLSA